MPPLTIFLNEDTKKLLHNKYVVIIGDSNSRGMYKDLVALLQGNEYLSTKDLRGKGEFHFMNDELIGGGHFGKMHNGINYREVRQYKTDYHLVRYYFVTKVYNKYWEDVIFPELQSEPVPDVVIINSCLWDLSRYDRCQKTSMESYKRNVEATFTKLNNILPLECLVMWMTSLPIAEQLKGGFMLPEIQRCRKAFRLDVMQGNFYCKELAKLYDIDVLDLNFYFWHQKHRRMKDGTHWNFAAHRRITNLILAHISVSWGVGLPRGAVDKATPTPQPDPIPDPQTDPRSESPLSGLYIDFDKVEAPPRKVSSAETKSGDSPRPSTPLYDEGAPDNKSGKSIPCLTSSTVPRGNTTIKGNSPVMKGPVTCGAVDRRPSPNQSPAFSFDNISLPANITLQPIDVSRGNLQRSSPILEHSNSRKERPPRAGTRFQPYEQQQNTIRQNAPWQQHPPIRSEPPLLPFSRPQTCQSPPLLSYQSRPHTQAQLPSHFNPALHQVHQVHSAPYPTRQQFPNPQCHGMSPDHPMYSQYLARVNERIAAERSNQMTRNMLYEAMLRFN